MKSVFIKTASNTGSSITPIKKYFAFPLITARENYRKRKRSADKIVEKQINFTDACIICVSPREAFFAFQPCGHSLACKKCSETLLKKGNPKCPYCRAVVSHYQQIFVQQSDL